jgi:hypothetical protein
VIGMAKIGCPKCFGLGLVIGRKGKQRPCGCVLRAVFRACFNKFKENEHHARFASTQAQIQFFNSGHQTRFTYGRRSEEYNADFYLIAKRTLDPLEWDVFRYHFLQRADWKNCCAKMRIDRGLFFHVVYRVERKLGKIFRELKPYGLFPIDEYFRGTRKLHDSISVQN